jgi:anti-sigma B factor antagonist
MGAVEGEDSAEIRIDTSVDGDGASVVLLAGELDISNAASLERTVASITADRPRRLVFDLSELSFMDSAGIAVLIGATSKVEEISLRNPSAVVRRVVELTGLTTVLPIEP